MKRQKIALITALAVIFIVLIYLFYRFGENRQVNWFTMYRQKEKQPYDLNVISKLLEDYFPEKHFSILNKPVSQVLPFDSTDGSYVFIGSAFYFSESDFARLYQFARIGNNVFIAADEIPAELLETIFQKEEYSGKDFSHFSDSSVKMNFTHPDLRSSDDYSYDFIYEWKKELFEWNYFTDSLFSNHTNAYIPLGILNDSFPNFIKVPYGEGAFYLHTNPIVFTNYFMMKPQGYQYAEKIFSHLSGSNIYWDEFSKVPRFTQNSIGNSETPLRYILSQTALKWSWYVLILMLILFVIFQSRRNQRIIPVTEDNSNTSLEFIHTIGRLYYQQNDHRSLALQKMKLFLAYIRTRYSIPTKYSDDTFVTKLAVKSEVSKKDITSILEEYKTIENMDDISAEQLFSFHAAIENFYLQCR